MPKPVSLLSTLSDEEFQAAYGDDGRAAQKAARERLAQRMVCDECAGDWPRHQSFCSAVASYTKEQIQRELLACEDRMASLSSLTEWCTKLPKCDGTLAAVQLRKSFSLVRHEFWRWADRLGVPVSSEDNVRHAMRDELRALRKSQQHQQDRPQATPPWKRRTNAA